MANVAFPTISTSKRLSNGTTYAYVHVKPKQDKPYILFLHGFPDSSYGWKNQIPYFSNLGYGLIVPDLLGYGGSDKPTEVEAYKLKKMGAEVMEILDAHCIKEVIGIGHDWGSLFLSRLANYYPSRFSKYAFISTAYNPPTGHFSVHAINDATQKVVGYPVFGYWLFFNDPDAGKLIDDHPESMRAIKYAADPTAMKDNVCPLNACRSFFMKGKGGPIAPWASQGELDTYDKILTSGGCGPPLNWYKAQIANLNTADEGIIVDEHKVIQKPTLLVLCELDYICVPVIQKGQMKPWVTDLTVREIHSGHWVQLEKAEELNGTLESFIKEGSPDTRSR